MEEKKLIIINFDDTYAGIKQNYNKRDDWLEGCAYRLNEMIPATNNSIYRQKPSATH